METPEEIEASAAADRKLAKDKMDDNPSFSDYLLERARWKEYLAENQRERDVE